MLPLVPPEITIPTTLPDGLAEADVDTPLECWWNPENVTSDVPLERWVNSPLAAQSTPITPGEPAKVKKLGLPLVLVLRRNALPPPATSPAGIWPLPPRNVQTNASLQCPMKKKRNACGLFTAPPRLRLTGPTGNPGSTP